MARPGSRRRRLNRELERRSHEALDILEEALTSDRPERVVLGVLIGDLLATMALFRDVRLELVAAAELLRVPPARVDPAARDAAFAALYRLADEIDRAPFELN